MARKKAEGDADQPKPDRHKPGKLVRVPLRMYQLLQELADEEFNTPTEQTKVAIREYLQRKGKLPKPKSSPE
jgi:hypothetical protein